MKIFFKIVLTLIVLFYDVLIYCAVDNVTCIKNQLLWHGTPERTPGESVKIAMRINAIPENEAKTILKNLIQTGLEDIKNKRQANLYCTQAISAVENLSMEEAVPVLLVFLKEKEIDASLRHTVIAALSGIKGTHLIPFLKDVTTNSSFSKLDRWVIYRSISKYISDKEYGKDIQEIFKKQIVIETSTDSFIVLDEALQSVDKEYKKSKIREIILRKISKSHIKTEIQYAQVNLEKIKQMSDPK